MDIEIAVAIIFMVMIVGLALLIMAGRKPHEPAFLPVVADPAHLPSRAHAADAGLDLRLTEDVRLTPGQRHLAGTGVKMNIPEGYVGDIRPRSGLAHKHGVTVLNSPGTVDAGYTGEIKVNLINLGNTSVVLRRGERIAQLVILAFAPLTPQIVPDMDTTDRGTAGHGSTGTN